MSTSRKLYLLCITLTALFWGCTDQEKLPINGQSVQSESSPQTASELINAGKFDRLEQEVFPAAPDLALIIPMEDAAIKAIEVFMPSWLNQVDDALMRSELAESIFDENWEEDWHLVSARLVPCSPLGLIANEEAINRLCWPQVRLIWQPILHSFPILGLIYYYQQ